jgi:methionine synthase II (cobalamin-independent)
MTNAAIATGIGSMPGTEISAAIAIAIDESPTVLFLPELPERGPGGEMIGRTFGLLNSLDETLSIETTPSGWRVSRGENRIMRRAKSWYSEDLENFELLAQSATDSVKFQFAGPISLTSFIEPIAGERLVNDLGAVRDVAAGLLEVLKIEIANYKKLFPMADVIVQIDEPGLELALKGQLRRRSGRGFSEPVPTDFVVSVLKRLAEVIDESGATSWIHSCATESPLVELGKAGFDVWAVPFSAINHESNFELIAAHWDKDGKIAIGVSSEILLKTSSDKGIISEVNSFAKRIGLPADEITNRLMVTPECGLAYSPNPALELKTAQRIASALEWQE